MLGNKFLNIKMLPFICVLFINCKTSVSGCFEVFDLNYGIQTPFRGPILLEVKGNKYIDKITGEKIVGDIYKSKIKSLFIIDQNDTLDNFSDIKLKLILNKTMLRLPTGRYRWLFRDSLSAMNQIKKEHLILELYSGEIIKLEYCGW